MFSLISCGGSTKGDEDKYSDGPFLKANDLAAPSEMDELTKEEVSDLISAEKRELYANSPFSGKSGDDTCLEEKFSRIKLRTGKEKIFYYGELDVTSCYKVDDEPGMTSQQSTSIRFYAELHCTGVDFSTFKNQSFAQFETARKLCSSSSSVEYIRNEQISRQTEIHEIAKESNSQFLTTTISSAESTPDLERCRYTASSGFLVLDDGCRRIVKEYTRSTSTSAPDLNYESTKFLSLTSVGIKKKNNFSDVWFDSGKWNTQINHWQGAIIYGNSATPPNYTLESSTDALSGAIALFTGVQWRQQAGSRPGDTIISLFTLPGH
jgi:hypothetical protein